MNNWAIARKEKNLPAGASPAVRGRSGRDRESFHDNIQDLFIKKVFVTKERKTPFGLMIEELGEILRKVEKFNFTHVEISAATCWLRSGGAG